MTASHFVLHSAFATAMLCLLLGTCVGQPPPTKPLLDASGALRAATLPPPASYGGGVDPSFRFVRVNGTRFFADAPSDSSSAFYFLGANLWQGMNLGALGSSGDRGRLTRDLDALVAAGVTQLRVLGASEGPDSEPWRIVPSLQPCPGVYNPDVLDGFDFLIAEMGKRKMRATVVLGDEWAWSGGHVQYVRWAEQTPSGSVPASACVPAGVDASGQPRMPNISNAAWRSRGFQDIPYPGPGSNSWSDYQALAGQFYESAVAQTMWRNHVRFMASHVSPYTGLEAKEDPTIMSWQLANEPRAADYSQQAGDAFKAWVQESSSFVKSVAPKQLVSTGMEGDTSYFSETQSVRGTQASPAVDFVTVHLWVQNWGSYAPSYDNASFVSSTLPWARAYLTASVAEAASLGKPVVLEEFGFPRDLGSLAPSAPTRRRDVYYRAIFEGLLASAASQGALAGVNFWAYAGEGRPAARGVPGPKPELCAGAAVPSGAASLSLTGAQPDWASCFINQEQRPAACSADSWWATRSAWPKGSYLGQDAWLGDPPHESQGWYSVFSNDTTMAVIKQTGDQLAAAQRCADAAVRPGGQGASSCTAGVPPGRSGNLC